MYLVWLVLLGLIFIFCLMKAVGAGNELIRRDKYGLIDWDDQLTLLQRESFFKFFCLLSGVSFFCVLAKWWSIGWVI